MMLAFPEYILSLAATNLFCCWVNHPRLQKLAKVDKVPWTLKHSMLVDMGGIAIRFTKPQDAEGSRQGTPQVPNPGICRVGADNKELQKTVGGSHCEESAGTNSRLSSSCHSTSASRSDSLRVEASEEVPQYLERFQKKQKQHLAGLGTIQWKPLDHHISLAASARRETVRLWDQNENAAPLQGNIWILNTKQLVLAREYDVIRTLPSIEESEIEDKSKSDILVRLLAILQVSWLAVELIARRVENVAFAPLELSTLAFSVCAFILYIVEWSKPKDVGVPFYIDTDVTVTSEAFESISLAASVVFLQTRYYYMSMSTAHPLMEGRYEVKHRDRFTLLATIVTTLLFGGIHLFAWDVDFPTKVESLLWKISALTATIAPTFCASLALRENIQDGTTGTTMFPQVCMIALGPIFLLARLYLIVESVRSLFFLPPEAFVATWASNIPHFT